MEEQLTQAGLAVPDEVDTKAIFESARDKCMAEKAKLAADEKAEGQVSPGAASKGKLIVRLISIAAAVLSVCLAPPLLAAFSLTKIYCGKVVARLLLACCWHHGCIACRPKRVQYAGVRETRLCAACSCDCSQACTQQCCSQWQCSSSRSRCC